MNKVYWTLALLVVFFLILGTNRIDQMHFERLKDSLTNIYNDRLVVKDYILDISTNLEEKHREAAVGNQAFFGSTSDRLSKEVDSLVVLFGKTELTRREGDLLDDFKKKNLQLTKAMRSYSSAEEDIDIRQDQVITQVKSMKTTLNSLSRIQVQEGRAEMLNANKSIQAIELFTRIEIIFLILIGIVIQALIVLKVNRIKNR
jgi:hypothetical protein